MIRAHGMWWPDLAGDYAKYIRRADELRPTMKLAKSRNVVVQAGGHAGSVPLMLAGYFKRVYTYEPERENFACLAQNTQHLEHVFAARGVIGRKHGCVGLVVHPKATGGHSVGGSGHVPSYRIDDLGLDACDAIYLDIEGWELHALRGAELTIDKFRPLIVCEENKKMHAKGFVEGDAAKLLAPFGYSVVDRVGEDLVLTA